jgi:2-polyprenyl-6-methoxyphenol hydroxylase-like FAD-dependent oxidoreductase
MTQETASNQAFTVVIVGGGLVGSLAAVMFAKRGWQVELYEMRKGEPILGKVALATLRRASSRV